MTGTPAPQLTAAERIEKLLFHLGKALWKSVPVVGPFVEELVFAQFEETLRPKVRERIAGLTLQQMHDLLGGLPTHAQIAALEQRLDGDGWDERLQIARAHADLVTKLSVGFGGLSTEVIRIKEVLQAIGANLAADDEARRRLGENERRRHAWTHRISDSQRQLLDMLSHEPTALTSLWQRAKRTVLRDATELEFRFRLHELEWLALIDRRRNGAGEWEYWRVIGPP